MSTGDPALVELIRCEISNHGPVSFAWFMEQVLYHPEHGYYSSDRATIGRRGDYFTNVSVGPVFGELLAAQFAEIWERIGKIDNCKRCSNSAIALIGKDHSKKSSHSSGFIFQTSCSIRCRYICSFQQAPAGRRNVSRWMVMSSRLSGSRSLSRS